MVYSFSFHTNFADFGLKSEQWYVRTSYSLKVEEIPAIILLDIIITVHMYNFLVTVVSVIDSLAFM